MRDWPTNKLIAEYIADGMRYEDGKIILPSGRTAKAFKNRLGYWMVALGPVDRRRCVGVGRLTCWFVHGPPPFPGAVVDHIDRNRSNDAPSNLRWVTISENSLNISDESKARIRESVRNRRVVVLRGADSPAAKLTDEHVLKIRKANEAGESQHLIAWRYGLSQSQVSRICSGMRWGHIPVAKHGGQA